MKGELKKEIKTFFPLKEGERIIKLVKNKGVMRRDSNSSEYKLTLRGINKLRVAQRLLKYPEIKDIVEVKRRK